MAYPYANTVRGFIAAIQQLRSNFPAKITSDTLKKWSIAPNNETYVLNVLRFLGIIDEDGSKRTEPAELFLEHDDAAFSERFKALVSKSYNPLFELWGDEAWTLDEEKLITFFRKEDESSAMVGKRQARTFMALSGLVGFVLPPVKVKGQKGVNKPQSKQKRVVRASQKTVKSPASQELGTTVQSPYALTVRVEVNLPVTNDQTVYDKIFKSMRKNLFSD